MKVNGFIRRIDDLGRIVIPKEIRKSLKIKSSDSIEIFLDNNDVVLRKFCPIDILPSFFSDFLDSINFVTGFSVLVCNNDKFICCSSDVSDKYLNFNISKKLEKIISNRTFIYESCSSFSFIDNVVLDVSYIISPLIVDGDVFGSCVFLSSNLDVNDNAIKSCVLATKFLCKYIE